MTNQWPQRTDGLTLRSKWYGDASIGPRCVGATVAIAVGAAQDPGGQGDIAKLGCRWQKGASVCHTLLYSFIGLVKYPLSKTYTLWQFSRLKKLQDLQIFQTFFSLFQGNVYLTGMTFKCCLPEWLVPQAWRQEATIVHEPLWWGATVEVKRLRVSCKSYDGSQ